MARQAAEGFALPLSAAPREARLVDDLPTDGGWQFEPKLDGFRCLAFRREFDSRTKSGKPLARYFPDVVERVRAMPATRFVIDSELVIVAHKALSCEALQLRLHHARHYSRQSRLALEKRQRGLCP